MDANLVSESNGRNALVRVRSRLIIDYFALTERSFTCVGRSGGKTAYATTTIYPAPASTTNLTDLMGLNGMNSLSGPKPSRIVLFYSVIFESIGQKVVLPCEVSGRPHPEVFWLDVEGNVISSHHDRYQVQRNGELVIKSLRWSDMGQFTCIARNPKSKDQASTFVYPIVSEN